MDDEVPKHKSTKNTRKWCKGKRGVEHILDVTEKTMVMSPTYTMRWQVLYCTACGKEMGSYMFGQKPDWVKQ